MKVGFLSIICMLTLSIPIVFYIPLEGYDLFRHYESYFLSKHKSTDLIGYYFGLSYLIQLLVSVGLLAQSMVFTCSLLFLFSIYKFNSFLLYGIK